MDTSGFMNLSKQKKDEEDQYLVPGLAMLANQAGGGLSQLQPSLDMPYSGNPAMGLMNSKGPLANTYAQTRFGMNLPEVRQRMRDAQDKLLSAVSTQPEQANPMMSAVAMMLANLGNVVAQSRGGGIAGGIGAGIGNAGVGMLAYQKANAQNEEMMRNWQIEQAKQQYQNARGELGLNMEMAPIIDEALGREMNFAGVNAQGQNALRLEKLKQAADAAKEQRLLRDTATGEMNAETQRKKLEYDVNPPQRKYYKEISFFDNPWVGEPIADKEVKGQDLQDTAHLKKSLYEEIDHNSNQLEPVLNRALTAAQKAQKSGSLDQNVLSNKISTLWNLSGATPEISDLQAATKQLSLLLKPSATGSLSDSDRKTLEEAIGSDKPLSTVLSILTDLKAHVRDPENMLSELEQYNSVHGYTSGFVLSRSAYKNYKSAFETASKEVKPLEYPSFLKNLSKLKQAEPNGVNNVIYGQKDPNIIQYTDDEGNVSIVDLRKLHK